MEALLIGVGVPVVLFLLAVLVLGFTFARLYRRSTREVSLVKTGTGGRKVIIDGGTLVIPVLHEVTLINMKTTRLEVRRDGNSALITKDRMRVDVAVEFYVTVQGTEEGIARAAQTLGSRTFDMDALRDMVEGKLIDGLRSVAAQMTLDQLHENRSDFVQQVQQTVSEDLTKNGLELESVSLTALDQTPLEGLAQDNVFNAVGMQHQADRLAESRMKRAAIEAEADVEVARTKQQAEIAIYEIERSKEASRVAQSVEMETLRNREAVDKAQKSEQARRESEEARIEGEKAVQTAEINRKRDLELAEQLRQISIQEKSEEESRARAAADIARAEAVRAEEGIKTERQVAEAERRKRITLLAAEETAQERATSVRVSAEAERAAADDRAAAMREMAQAEADQITIRAEANKADKLADAEGTRAQIDAENSLSPEILEFRLAKARLDALPGIVAEMVKPAEKIGGIYINRVDGLSGHSGGGGEGGGDKGLVNQAFDEMRAMAFQLPALTALGKSVGVNLEGGLEGLVGKEFGAAETPATAPDRTPDPAA